MTVSMIRVISIEPTRARLELQLRLFFLKYIKYKVVSTLESRSPSDSEFETNFRTSSFFP